MGQKKDKIEWIWKIGSALGIALILYVIVPMETRLTKRLDKIEQKQEDQFDKFLNYYNECNNKISQLQQDTQKEIAEKTNKAMEKIDTAIDRIYAWFKERDGGKL